jgi:hypothetical protein
MLLARILGLSKTAIGYESDVGRHNLAKSIATTVLERLHLAGHLPEAWSTRHPFSICKDVTTVKRLGREGGADMGHAQPM